MKTLKEKFGQFALMREVKGGTLNCCELICNPEVDTLCNASACSRGCTTCCFL